MNKTLHREAELQRRHVRWYKAVQGNRAVRLFKAARAFFNQNEIDHLKRMGVVK